MSDTVNICFTSDGQTYAFVIYVTVGTEYKEIYTYTHTYLQVIQMSAFDASSPSSKSSTDATTDHSTSTSTSIAASTDNNSNLLSPTSWNWNSFIESTQKHAIEFAGKAQEMADKAGRVAQEKATALAQKAHELHQNYDMEVATSILLQSLGATNIDITNEGGNSSRKVVKKNQKLDLVYMTENIIAMGFPNDPKKPVVEDGGNDINIISNFLLKRHKGHYMVWNVSEESYNYSLFSDQVLEYKFPGHPAPPLGLLFKICTAVESWLDADSQNVAVVHCLTGKGRTAALVACILTWIGEFFSPMEALQYAADRRGIPVDILTIPSQRRYVHYFSNMLDGVKPRSEALLLRRIIINSIPIFGDNGGGDGNLGCCPYVQLFKCGRLIATAAPPTQDSNSSNQSGAIPPTGSSTSKATELKWITTAEGSVSFPINCAVQGDILLRVRHADSTGIRVSMFRAAFHTGYVPCGVLRLTKVQLDGACTDPRFADDFFIDLIFAPIEKSSSTTMGVPSDSGLTIDSNTADKYELSLHKDTRFWDAVAARKSKSRKRKPRKFATTVQEQFSISDEATGDSSSSSGNSSSSSASSQFYDIAGSNDDLIMQLAQAENVEYDNSDSSSSVGKTEVISSANVELRALEELEKELGLDLSSNDITNSNSSGIANSSDGISSIATANHNAMSDAIDDLDDLEKYLESLN